MGKKVLLFSLILSLLFCVPAFATQENGEETVPEIVVSAEEVSLNSFKEQANNKGKTEKVYISIVEAPVEAETPVESETTATEDKGVTNQTENKAEVEKTLYFTITTNGEEVKFFSILDKEFELWMDEIKDSVLSDAKAGLGALTQTKVTLDHIKLATWGEFFNDYYGKSMTSFPVKDIVIKYGDYEFIFKRTDDSKAFILNTFIPPLIGVIEEEAVKYPVKRYALQIESGSLLKDYVCDLNSVREISTILPFDGVEEYIFYNVGDYFGMGIARNYVDVLRGYLEGDSKGYDRPVKGDVPGCVNVLSYITLLRNVSGGTLSDKVLSDFTLYKELAVCLDTKELIDTTNMTTENQDLRYGDFKLDADVLVLCPIKDTVVIIQPTYLECFLYGGVNQGLARWIDATNFISTGETNLIVRNENGETSTVPLSHFCESNGFIDTRLGQAPFLVYYTSYTPYDLLVDWGYNKSGSYFSNEEQQTAFIEALEKDLKSQGRSDDFKAYVKAAGHTPESTKTLIIGIVVGVILIALLVVGIILYKKLKKLNSPIANPNAGVLFADNDFNDDDDDDTYGSFELK